MYQCPACHRFADETIRICIEIVDKKTKKITERLFGQILCYNCFALRYKGRTKLRIYV